MTMGPGHEGPAGWPAQGTAAPHPPGPPPPGYSQPQGYPPGGFAPPQGYPGPQAPAPNQGFAPPGQYRYPPPKDKNKIPWIIASVLVVVLLLAGGGYFAYNALWKKGNDSAGKDNMPRATLKQAWTTSGTNDRLVGLWQTDHSVIRISSTGVTGYDLSSGKKLYTVAAPGPGLVPCSASPTLSPGGVGSVFYSKDGNFSCDTVIGVDAKTGKQLWMLHSENKVVDGATGSTFIDGSVVVIASDSNAVAGVDATTGNTIWSYTSSAKGCAPQHTGGAGSIVMVQEHCEGSGIGGAGEYVAVDAATGKHLWQTPTARDYYMRAVISTKPVVILASSTRSTLSGSDLKDGSEFLAFDSTGKQTTSIPADDDQAGTNLTTPFPNAVVSGGTLYADTQTEKGPEGVTAYNVATGAKLWTYKATFEGMALISVWLTGLAPDSSPLVLIDLDSIGNACPVEKLDPATGKPSQQYVLADKVDPEKSLLIKASNGDYLIAPLDPKVGPGLTVMAPK